MKEIQIPEKVESFLVIGGGSAYTPGLFSAILHHRKDLKLREVRLYDIDQENLQTVSRLCQKMAKALGAPFEVKAFSDLDSALSGVDVILNSSRPGGFDARRIDESLPLEFGIPGQETVGPGGFFFALRSIPEALALARKINQIAPDALLLNYTNPTNIVTQVLSDSGLVSVIGLCDQSDEDVLALAEAMGRKNEGYALNCYGLNHGTWYSDIQIGGKTLRSIPKDLSPPSSLDEDHQLRFQLSMEIAPLEKGLWPNSYLTYYHRPEAFVKLMKQLGPRADRITAKLDSYYEHFAKEAEKEKPDLRHHRGTEGFGDMAVNALMALSSEKPKEMILNLPAESNWKALSKGTVRETKARISKVGVSPIEAGEAPSGFDDLVKRLEEYQLNTAEAASKGDAALIESALASNPLVGQTSTAHAMLIEAKKRYGNLIKLL